MEQYCGYYQLSYVTDSTNFEKHYTRNRIRLDVVPVLKQINPLCEEAILHLTQQCKDDIDYLEQQAEDALSKAEGQGWLLYGCFFNKCPKQFAQEQFSWHSKK